MILHDDGHGITDKSLAFFMINRDKLGDVKRVMMLDSYDEQSGWIKYPFRIVGSNCEIWLSGCAAGYGGERPHGTMRILEALGYPSDVCRSPLLKRSFAFGPPDAPMQLVEPSPELDEATRLVLDVIVDFFRDCGVSPTLQEISEESDLSYEQVLSQVKALEMAGKIRRFGRKSRAIQLV